MQDSRFTHSFDTLQQISQDILNQAKKTGASACEAEVSQGFGQNVTVRHNEVETIEYNRDKGLGVTVYFGQRRGHASTSDLSPAAVRDAAPARANCRRGRRRSRATCTRPTHARLRARDPARTDADDRLRAADAAHEAAAGEPLHGGVETEQAHADHAPEHEETAPMTCDYGLDPTSSESPSYQKDPSDTIDYSLSWHQLGTDTIASSTCEAKKVPKTMYVFGT